MSPLARALLAFGLCCGLAFAWAPIPRQFQQLLKDREVPAASQCVEIRSRPDFAFPRDLGRHTKQSFEIWWFLGHAEDPVTKRRFGVEVSILRIDLEKKCTTEDEVLYALHVGIADVAKDRYHYAISGTYGKPVQSSGEHDPIFFLRLPGVYGFEQTGAVLSLFGIGKDETGPNLIGFNATLRDRLGVTLMGDDGFEYGSPDPVGIAHIEQMRLSGTGMVGLGPEQTAVQVEGFIQHIWHHNYWVASNPGGWDWRYAQLSNGWAISGTHYRFDAERFSPDYSYFNLIQPQPAGPPLNIYLGSDKWTISRSVTWISPRTNTTYYMQHDLSIPSYDLHLTWRTLINDNEMTSVCSATYYEGAADVTGTLKGAPITGRGFTEGMGYCDDS